MRTGTTHQIEAMEPPVLLSADDYHRLSDLVKVTLARYPADDAQLLLEELHRADIVPTGWVPSDVVMMGSHVEFRNDQTGTVRRVQLVYPYQADIKKGRISILSLVGAALIGLAVGQSISWRTKSAGNHRRLTVLRVSTEPFHDGPGASQAADASHVA